MSYARVPCATALGLAVALAAAPAVAATDVQSPQLAAPQRGSVAGEYANVAFGPADVSRGGFSLPSPMGAPSDRGPLGASIFPTYSPDAGLGEWGLGWQTTLAITRWRPIGDLDFTSDELTSPWGHLKKGTDGNWYPLGLSSTVRVQPNGETFIAYLPDGSTMTFGGAAQVKTGMGAYAWYLTDVASPTHRRTHLEWTRNSSGRLFLQTALYGGHDADYQYRVTFAYESVTVLFASYASGQEQLLDQRVRSVLVEARNGSSGAFAERWHYDLTYQEDPNGPAFFLTQVAQRFASGESPPPMSYHYRSARDRLLTASFAPAPALDPLLARFGEDVIQGNRSAQLDSDLDGRPDLEDRTEFTLLQRTDDGFAVQPLPPPTKDTFELCRPPASPDNLPRTLVQMNPTDDSYQVLSLLPDLYGIHTEVDVCDRAGTRLATKQIDGYWMTSNSQIRVADVNRDRQPDLIALGYGEYIITPNTSRPGSLDFGAPIYGLLDPAFDAAAFWIHDFNGDGLPDLVARDSASLTVWFGTGNYQFLPEGKSFGLETAGGIAVTNLDAYQFNFLDANRDGLTDLVLTRGNSFTLFVNNGSYFVEVALPAFNGLDVLTSEPVVADLLGSGNAQLVVTLNGHASALELDEPGTSLMSTADDGRGTVLRFSYGRAPAAAGGRQRHAVLTRLDVESSGYGNASYSYAYDTPRVHSVGKYLLGFDGVTRQGGLTTDTAAFHNDDDVVALLVGDRKSDALAPEVVQFESREYDAVVSQGVPWMRRRTDHVGWQTADSSQTLEERTDYLAYDGDVCPISVRQQSSAGTLLTTVSRADVPALAMSMHCLESDVVKTGTHADHRFDFRHEHQVDRNEIGLVTHGQAIGGAGALDEQTVAYNPDYTVASISAPGRGSSLFAYAPGTTLLSRVVAPDGVVTEVDARDAVFDGILQLTTDRGGAQRYTQQFRYDGQERLQKSWDNLGLGSEQNPLTSISYRYGNATQPAAISTRKLIDAALGVAEQSVELQTARGEPIATASLLPEGWTFDHVVTRTPMTGESLTQLRPTLASATNPSALDYPTLLAGTQLIGDEHQSSFGITADTLTQLHADVARRTTTRLLLSQGRLVQSETENGTLTTTRELDAKRRVVAITDPGGVRFAYRYDALGRLRAVDLPDGTGHRVTFDDYEHVTRIERDGIANIVDDYDPTTALLTRQTYQAPDGAALRAVSFGYDGAGRKTSERDDDLVSGASQQFTWYWDGATPANPQATSPLGLISAVTGDGYTKLLEHRPDGKLTHETLQLAGWRNVETSWTFADDGSEHSHRTVVRAADGSALETTELAESFDGFGRLGALQLGGTPLATLSYDGNGALRNVAFSDGGSATFQYDALTRVPLGLTQATAAWQAQDAYRFNARGLVDQQSLSLAAQSVTRQYGYSPRGFLTSSSDAQASFGYAYDALGLPTKIVDADGERTLSTSGGRLLAGAVVYQLDRLGRTTARDDLQLAYLPNGQIGSATRGAQAWSFKYDEDGQRLLKLVAGTPVAAYPGGRYLDAGGLTEPLRVGGRVVGVLQHGQFRATPVDHVGTALGDSDGTARFASPYGDRAVHPEGAAALDYVTKGYDADLGVIRMGVRDYDARINRFLTPDPLFLSKPDECVRSPIECNLYSYAGGDPISNTDPNGTCLEDACVIETAAVVGFGFLVIGAYITQPAGRRNFAAAADQAGEKIQAATNGLLAAIATKIAIATAQTKVDVRWDSTRKGEEGHHTVPRALMQLMHDQGLINDATLEKLWPADRPGTLKVDRVTHFAIHKGLTAYLAAKHPGMKMRLGFQIKQNWNNYLDALKREGANDPMSLKIKILSDFAGYYKNVAVVPSMNGLESPLLKFGADAANLMASPIGLPKTGP